MSFYFFLIVCTRREYIGDAKILFLLSEHVLCKESIVIAKKFDSQILTHLYVLRIHLCYFYGDVHMYVCE